METGAGFNRRIAGIFFEDIAMLAVSDLKKIAKDFSRDEQHLLKYLLRELATPGKLEGTLLIIGRKISSTLINQKIKQYAHTYVLCFTCGKPDTQIIVKEGKTLLKCTACGAQIPIK